MCCSWGRNFVCLPAWCGDLTNTTGTLDARRWPPYNGRRDLLNGLPFSLFTVVWLTTSSLALAVRPRDGRREENKWIHQLNSGTFERDRDAFLVENLRQPCSWGALIWNVLSSCFCRDVWGVRADPNKKSSTMSVKSTVLSKPFCPTHIYLSPHRIPTPFTHTLQRFA